MTVRIVGGTAFLEDHCPIEDAESLIQHLLLCDRPTVDWSSCDSAHTAVIQVLMVANPTLFGVPRGAFLKGWVMEQFIERK